jgi:hypothetical protein
MMKSTLPARLPPGQEPENRAAFSPALFNDLSALTTSEPTTFKTAPLLVIVAMISSESNFDNPRMRYVFTLPVNSPDGVVLSLTTEITCRKQCGAGS